MSAIIGMDATDFERPNFGPGPADYAVEGEPIESAYEHHSKDDWASGVWGCSPGRILEENHAHDEF